MGLQKTQTVGSGVTGNYWKITDMSIGWLSHSMIVDLQLFVDKAAADAKLLPLDTMRFSFKDADFDFVSTDNLVQKTYDKIKLVPGFISATDVYESGQPE